MKTKYDRKPISELWQEHLATPFPKRLRGKDIDGIDFVVLDADIAGCVSSLLDHGKLNLYQTAVLGLSYQQASHVVSVLSNKEAAYYARLERLAELVLIAMVHLNRRSDYS